MHALVPAQVDLLHCLSSAVEDRVGQLTLRPRQREHRAVVVGIGVDVEQPGVEGGRHPLDRPPVAALGDVRYRQQRQPSSSSSTNRPASSTW